MADFVLPCHRDHMAMRPKIFTIWIFTEKKYLLTSILDSHLHLLCVWWPKVQSFCSLFSPENILPISYRWREKIGPNCEKVYLGV